MVTLIRASMKSIATEVAIKHNIYLTALYNLSRNRYFSWPRQEAMSIMKSNGFSYKQIANHFNLKDHTTIVYGIEAFNRRDSNWCASQLNTKCKSCGRSLI